MVPVQRNNVNSYVKTLPISQ